MKVLNHNLTQWRARGELIEVMGRRLFVARAGSGPTLLLVHGYPTSSYDWHPVWNTLAKHFTLIAPDFLGMGFSDKPRNYPYGVQSHADLLESVVKHCKVKRMHVMAHDLGVSVAQEMVARRQIDALLAPIDAMVLLNGGVCPEAYQPRAIQRLLISPLGPWIGPRIPQRLFERTLRKLFGTFSQPTPQLLADFWALVCHKGGREVTHLTGRFYIDRLLLRDRLVDPLVSGAVPVQLINGEADPNSGRHMADRYREVVPNADVISLEHIGHWPQIEAPEAVLNATVAFFDRYSRSVG